MPATGPPTVSVVIPHYNYARTLPLCLASVSAQTYAPLEVIVSDDGSTDDSVAIARECGATVVEGPNGGVSAARNRGIAASRGDIVFFLDSDEALEPDAIANAVELLLADPGLGCVHGILAAEPLIDDGIVERYRTLHAHHWRRRSVGETGTALFAQAAIWRRVLDEVGGFDERLRDSEDAEYSNRLAVRHRILLTDRIVARHDEEHRLGRLLAEQVRRSQQLVPTVLAHRAQRRAGLRTTPVPMLAAAALTVLSLPLFLLHPALFALPPLFLLLFVLADPTLLRFVATRRRPTAPESSAPESSAPESSAAQPAAGKSVGLLAFYGMHFLLHLAMLAGAAIGAVRHVAARLTPRQRRALQLGFGLAVGAAALAAVVLPLRADGPALAARLREPGAGGLLAVAVAANLGGLWLAMLSWRVLLPSLPFRPAGHMFFVGQLSKYLPGRVWSVLAHVELGRRAGQQPGRVVGAYLTSFAISTLTGLLVGALALPAVAGPAGWWGTAAAVAAAAAILVRPGLIVRPVAVAARLTKRAEPRVATGTIRAGTALALVSWLVSGVHLWALATLFGAAPAAVLLLAIGAFPLATVVGSLAVILPDGWGLREVTMGAALAGALTWPVAGAVAVASRLVCVVCEVVLAGLVVAVLRPRTVPAGGQREERADAVRV